MSPVSSRTHALWAQKLIHACGGLDEIVRAGACRLKRSRLAECMNPNGGAYMPADVIGDLEAYCGTPHYSRAMAEARPSAVDAACLMTEACETVEGAAGVLSQVREAIRDGELTPREQDDLNRTLNAFEEQIRELRAAVQRGKP